MQRRRSKVCVNGDIKADLKGRVPPTYNKLTSQRCDGYGVLSAITTYKSIQLYIDHRYEKQVYINEIIMYSDSESLIDSINLWKERNWTTKFHYSPDADLIRQIMEEYKHLRRLQINVIFRHVRGHQDRLKRQLTLPEQLNVEADHLATEALRIRSAPPIILPWMTNKSWHHTLLSCATHTHQLLFAII
jgi:RNase H